MPSSRRIIEDTDWFIHAIKVISDHQGVAVPGLGSRKGHRNNETRKLKKRGGKRIKKEFSSTRFVHKDAEACRDLCIQSSIKFHSDAPKEEPKEESNADDDAAVDGNIDFARSALLQQPQILSSRPCKDWEVII